MLAEPEEGRVSTDDLQLSRITEAPAVHLQGKPREPPCVFSSGHQRHGSAKGTHDLGHGTPLLKGGSLGRRSVANREASLAVPLERVRGAPRSRDLFCEKSVCPYTYVLKPKFPRGGGGTGPKLPIPAGPSAILRNLLAVDVQVLSNEGGAYIILDPHIETLQDQIDHFLLRPNKDPIRNGMLLPSKPLVITKDKVPILLDWIILDARFWIEAIDAHCFPAHVVWINLGASSTAPQFSKPLRRLVRKGTPEENQHLLGSIMPIDNSKRTKDKRTSQIELERFPMYVRAYLRASTKDQDATRARDDLYRFARERGLKIAATYTENESGASLKRPELFRLLSDCHPGDILLVEQVDRLSRLNADDWEHLKAEINGRKIKVVALDLPTSWMMATVDKDDIQSRMLEAINGMMLDMLAAIARKDYEDRRRRQIQGIEKAKAKGDYKGRPEDTNRNVAIMQMLAAGQSWTSIQNATGCSRSTLSRLAQRVRTQEAAIV